MIRRAFGLARSLAIYWRPGRQRGLRALYAPFVQRGDLVFDVGAHLGDRTAAFAALGARVVALEPQAHVLPWLRRLVGNRDGVTIVPSAVGREVGSAVLAVSDAHPSVSTLSDGWREGLVRDNPGFRRVRWSRGDEVPVTTMDELIRGHGTPRFCKIDVEGHEAEVLAGLSRPLDALSFEFVAGGLTVPRACVERLEALGAYEYNAIEREGRRFRWSAWLGAGDVLGWIDEGAEGVPSGDVYARLVSSHRRPNA